MEWMTQLWKAKRWDAYQARKALRALPKGQRYAAWVAVKNAEIDAGLAEGRMLEAQMENGQ